MILGCLLYCIFTDVLILNPFEGCGRNYSSWPCLKINTVVLCKGAFRAHQVQKELNCSIKKSPQSLSMVVVQMLFELGQACSHDDRLSL